MSATTFVLIPRFPVATVLLAVWFRQRGSFAQGTGMTRKELSNGK